MCSAASTSHDESKQIQDQSSIKPVIQLETKLHRSSETPKNSSKIESRWDQLEKGIHQSD